MSNVERTKTQNVQPIAHVLNEDLGQSVDVFNTEQNKGRIFAKGFGQTSRSITDWSPIYGGQGVNYGGWVIIPNQTFDANVKVWGAGGGSRGHDTGNAYAGGGGFSSATIRFYKDTPYAVMVGQGGDHVTHRHSGTGMRGNYRLAGTYGNGGGGAHHGGNGGGLSGVFFNTFVNQGGSGSGHGAIASTFRGPNRSNALIIAGGGGGQGYHSQGHHGGGGGGGGTTGNNGHNANGGSQTGGGGNWGHGTQAGYAFHGGHAGDAGDSGGGGGGWFGGAGGAHHSSHHNGGGGGSGHLLDLHSTSGYPNFWLKQRYPDLVRNGSTSTAPGVYNNHNVYPGNHSDSDWMGAGLGGGSQGQDAGQQTFGRVGLGNWHTGYNGRVVITVTDSNVNK